MKKFLIALLVLGLAGCGTSTGGSAGKSGRSGRSYVKRSQFTTSIRNREPQNTIRQLGNDRQKVYYFTELTNMQGQTVRHRWKYKGKVMAEVEFKVKGPRWRVFSSKWLERRWVGKWTASVVSRTGRRLASSSFTYTRSAKRSAPAKAAAAAGDAFERGSAAAEDAFERGSAAARELWNDVFGD